MFCEYKTLAKISKFTVCINYYCHINPEVDLCVTCLHAMQLLEPVTDHNALLEIGRAFCFWHVSASVCYSLCQYFYAYAWLSVSYLYNYYIRATGLKRNTHTHTHTHTHTQNNAKKKSFLQRWCLVKIS